MTRNIRNLTQVFMLFTWLFGYQLAQSQQTEFLFNGKDLKGWKGYGGQPEKNWSVENGVLSCTGAPGASWIYFDKEFSDFELKLEFKMSTDANSGVFIRAPKTGDPWVTGIEIQLLDDYGDKWKSLPPDGFTGAIYGALAPSSRVTRRAGEWQELKVVCKGHKCSVWVNGKQVIDADLKKLAVTHAKKVPGLNRKSGLIGLQNHGDQVSFRKITLLDLKKEK